MIAIIVGIFFKATAKIKFSLPIFSAASLLTTGYFFARVMATGGIANALVSRVIPAMIIFFGVTILVFVLRGSSQK